MADHTVKDYWSNKLEGYSKQEWVKRPSLFAQTAAEYFPKKAMILELGAGIGQDSKWFVDQGFEVLATDLADRIKLIEADSLSTRVVDLSNPLPFRPESFDVVYSHLALHYFSSDRTQKLFGEIYSCLKPGGIFAMLVNSIHDPELQEGKYIENNFLEVDGIQKRYFDISFIEELTKPFETLLLDEEGTSYKDKAVGLTHLIRFIGRKKDSQ